MANLDPSRALQVARALFASQPGVTGIDYGYAHRTRDGKHQRTEELCLRIHVNQKKPPALCRTREIVPREIDGIRTDVVERRYYSNAGASGAAGRLVQAGRGVGNPKARAGTIGLVVYDGTQPAILSCEHVLAGPKAAIGDAILLPAVEAGGKIPDDVVASLTRFLPQGSSGDFAIARIEASRAFDTTVLVSGAKISTTAPATLGDVLEKVGSTTGLTRGIVEGIGDYLVQPGNFLMTGLQIGRLDETRDLSLPGDSGSVWYTRDTHYGVGVHVASGVDDTGHAFAIACKLDTALELLGATLEAQPI
jgi:hypothetical protein